MKLSRKIICTVTVVVTVAVLLCAIVIMATGAGLVEGYDLSRRYVPCYQSEQTRNVFVEWHHYACGLSAAASCYQDGLVFELYHIFIPFSTRKSREQTQSASDNSFCRI